MTAPELLPDDEFNRALTAQVHPADYENPVPSGRYNLVVIGAGTAGLVCAAGAAGLGAKVALIERHLLGGDCLNYGCVPSKGIIAAARALAHVREAEQFGVRLAGTPGIDFSAAMSRMRELRAGIARHDSVRRFTELGVDVYLGDAAFVDRHTVRVADRLLPFRKAVIATGARAAIPDIPGHEDVAPLTNETLFSLTELPGRLAIVGGGPIGCEMAQTFARFGARVTLYESASNILSREDTLAADVVRDALRHDGVELKLGASIQRFARIGDSRIVEASVAGETDRAEFDQILVAAGRRPNVAGLNLGGLGIDYDERTGIRVDDRLRTTCTNIFAAGDVCSAYQFTHAADFLARIVLRNALFPFGRARASRLIIPWCTYTDPELAHVGLSERTAREQNVPIDTFRQPFAGVDRSILEGKTSGFVQIHVRRGTDRIVGATIVGHRAGELISQITQAMSTGAGLARIANVIHPYPTEAEAIRKLGDQYNRSRLTPFVAGVLRRWLNWRR